MVQALLQCTPEVSQFDATISAQEVRFAIDKLDPHKARGMDGWSNAELKLLHEEEVQMLADFFNQIGHLQLWPQTLSVAWVSLLSKVPQPLRKIMAAKVFVAILPVLPEDLYGSVPGRSTLDAAWELQSTLEEALYKQESVMGVTLDLSKAYNTLPRSFLRQLAGRCGWPESLVNTYMNFLGSLRRFFRIHDGLHAGTSSTVGVPEGCPLAVPMMIMLTMSVTNLIRHQGGRFLSFVDNWTMLSSNVGHLQSLPQRVKWATDGLGLLLNPEKTAAFATCAQGRAALRKVKFADFPLQVVHATHDLGVTFTSTKKVTSCAIAERLDANQTKLERLQCMPWKTQRKSQMLCRVVAPSVLYGCSLASTSPTLMASIRGKFNVAVWGKNSHRNHFIAPLFGGAEIYEPFHIIFVSRIQALRRAAVQQPQATARRWTLAIGDAKSTGPFRYLLDFLELLQWKPLPHFCVKTPTKTVDLVAANFKDVQRIMQQDWLLYVAEKLSDKDPWSALYGVDFQFSRKLRSSAKIDLAMLGNFTAGAAIFTDQKKHFLSEGDTRCVHCDAQDSQAHRMFQCPFYASCREHIPMQFLQSLPDMQVQRGLFKKPYALQLWDDIVTHLPAPDFFQEFDDHVCIFTDGSTMSAETVPCSAWSVVVADTDKLDSAIVESGWLHGMQDNYRAELCAAMVAIPYCAVASLFIDNEAVVRGLKRLQISGWQTAHWQRHDHRDLWWKLWSVWKDRQPKLWNIYHVHSHQDINAAKSWHHAWLIYNNMVADQAAVKKNLHRPPDQMQALAMARMEFKRVKEQAGFIFQLQKNILSLVKKSHQPSVAPSFPQQDRSWTPVFQVSPHAVGAADAMLCPRFLSVLAEFMAGQWVKCEPVMSVMELYIIFVHVTGWLVPVNIASWDQQTVPLEWRTNIHAAWLHETTYPALKAARQPLHKQLVTFQHALKRLLKDMEVPAVLYKTSVLRQYGRTETVQSISSVPSIFLFQFPDIVQ